MKHAPDGRLRAASATPRDEFTTPGIRELLLTKRACASDGLGRMPLAMTNQVNPPLLDARGRPRSPITVPGFNKGRSPKNKGRKMPAEVLSQEEVAALLDSFSVKTLPGKRSRAMVALMYRAEVKVGQLVDLAVKHYDEPAGALKVPILQGREERRVRLDPSTRRILDEWMEARAELKLRGTAPLFCTIEQVRGGRIRPAYIRTMLTNRAVAVGIQRRVTPEGLRKSRGAHRDNEAGRFEKSIAEYVSAEAFRLRYPVPHRKWSEAHQLLETAPDSLASAIGHLCREAVEEFSDELVQRYDVGPFESNKTKAKVRAVFATQEELSPSVRKSLEALVAYWETVSDLVQRQEHGRRLAAEDGRRIVFQTMLVMREIDLTLSAPGDA
jgi:integrase